MCNETKTYSYYRRESPELETSPGATLTLWQLHTTAEMN